MPNTDNRQLIVARTVQVSVVLALLVGTINVDILTWSECVRIVLIGAFLGWVAWRHRETIQESGPSTGGAALLALCCAFAVTQFDPETSAVHLKHPQDGTGFVFLIGTVLGLVCGLAVLLGYRPLLTWSSMGRVDRVLLGVLIAVGLLTAVSGQSVPVSRARLATGLARTAAFAGFWFGITRVYGDPRWTANSDGWLRRWHGPLAALVILFVSAIGSGVVRTSAVLGAVGEGEEALDRGDYVEAARLFATADSLNWSIDIGTVSRESLRQLAFLQITAGETEAGRRTLSRLGGHFYHAAERSMATGDVYYRAGAFEDAVQAYEEAWLTPAPRSDLLNRLGRAYLKVGDTRRFYDLVVETGQVPVVVNPTYEEMVFLGNVELYRGRFGTAIDIFRRAAAQWPEDAYLIYKVGMSQVGLGETDGARESFQSAVGLDDGFADAYFQLSVLAANRGQDAASRTHLERVAQLLPTHHSLIQRDPK